MTQGYAVMWSDLPIGQREALDALVGQKEAVTYRAAAESLGLGIGTLYTQLKRIRDRKPLIYNRAMAIRRSQLDRRHQEAVDRADSRSHQYFKNLKKHIMEIVNRDNLTWWIGEWDLKKII